jgi:transglutaminase-like putative cysteine protease
MRLFVRHRTEYAYSEPQARLVQLLRLTPGSHAGQSIVSWNIEVDRDARLKPSRDGYGNETTMLYIDGPIERISIAVSGEVLTEDRAGLVFGTAENLPPLHFLQSTSLTAGDPAIAAFVRDLGLPEDRLARAHTVADALHDRLKGLDADPGADHRATKVFAKGASDAQGAAHLLIAAAHVAGFPARYAAGHLYRPEAVDSHAAHGWAEIHVDGYGWIGFDALEGQCPTEAYVRVAIGLDHHNAAPISGARIGGGDEALMVDVHVGPEPAPQD